MPLVLAAKPDVAAILLLIGIILILVIVGGLFLLHLRRRILETHSGPQQHGGLLDDLRAMLERGEISQEEFDSTKAAMAARLTGKAPPKPAMPPGAVRRPDGTLVAKPGVDLTGAPLPEQPGSPPPSAL
jgi:hypothetical protein